MRLSFSGQYAGPQSAGRRFLPYAPVARLSLLVILLSIPLHGSLSQQKENDSVKTYVLKGVVITATLSPVSLTDSPCITEIMDAQIIQNANGTTLADVLGNAGGLYVKDYGGNGALKTASLRGSSPEHLLVLVNGNRLNSSQNGLVDLSLIPANDIERIELVHGGSSALYGADAIGGVINIITRSAAGMKHLRSELTAGSFGFQKYLLEIQGHSGSTGFLSSYSSETGRDDFAFNFRRNSLPDTTLNRKNADFTRKQLFINCDLPGVKMTAQYAVADRGVPGPFRGLQSAAGARQSDSNLNLSGSYENNGSEALNFVVRGCFQYNLETYIDPDPVYPMNSYYKNIFGSVNPQAALSVSPDQKLIIGCELGQATLEGNDFGVKITRLQKAAYVAGESHFDFERSFFDRLSLYQTVRYDQISDAGFALTPKFGINFRVLREGDIRFRTSVGENFRSPSFNDLYYPGFSNPALKPERSTSFDASVSAGFNFCGEQSASLAYFHIDTQDRILLNPFYVPSNIGRVISDGAEFGYDGQFLGKSLIFGVKYTFTDARKKNSDYAGDSTYDKQLPYTPLNMLVLSLKLSFNPISANIVQHMTGLRYTAQDNLESLPSYGITDANLTIKGITGPLNVELKAEVNNLFNADYEMSEFYPMPGRSFRFILGAEY